MWHPQWTAEGMSAYFTLSIFYFKVFLFIIHINHSTPSLPSFSSPLPYPILRQGKASPRESTKPGALGWDRTKPPCNKAEQAIPPRQWVSKSQLMRHEYKCVCAYVCVYMFFKYIQVYGHTTRMYMCLSVLEVWDLCWVIFIVALHIVSISTLEMKSLTEPRTHLFGYNGWSVSPTDLPVSASPVRGLPGFVTMSNSYVGAEAELGVSC